MRLLTSILFATIALIGLTAELAAAKEYTIRKHNNASYAAACDRSATCINWGGGVYTNGDTKVICTKTKCTMYEDEAPS